MADVFANINKTTSPGVAPSLIEYYEKTLLTNAKPELVHGRDAQKKPLPLHNGKVVNFRKMVPFPAVTTPLYEGITPAGQTIQQTALSAMVKPYGDYVPLTDEMQFVMLDDMHKETARLLSDQALLSLDTISRDAMNAGMNVQYANTKTARAQITAADRLTVEDVRKAVRTLKRNNCKPFPDGFYHAVVHPDTVHDLTAADNPYWIDVAKYQDKAKIEKYELGTMFKVKFFESSNAKVFTAESVLFGIVAELNVAAGATVDTVTRSLLVAEEITGDEARALTGRLVDVSYSSGTAQTTTVCIERVDAGAAGKAKVYFKWLPTDANLWTAANTAKIVPSGGGAAGAPVYSTLIYGQDSYGNVSLGNIGDNVEIIIHGPGSAGADDPINQRSTIAWKVKGFCCVVLQDAFMVRIEHGASV